MDVEAVKTQTEEVSKKFYAVSEKLYKAAAGAGAGRTGSCGCTGRRSSE